jgi:predicted RNA-binding Zn-ribbon protein involved in translation (DUF1610 family)
VSKYRCNRCQWDGDEEDLDWSDNTSLEVVDGEKPKQSIIPLCPQCGEEIQ